MKLRTGVRRSSTQNSDCPDKHANVLACVGGDSVQYVMNADGSQQVKTISSPQQLLMYSSVDSSHIGDMDSFRQRIEDAAKKQMEDSKSRFREQVTRIEERITTLKEKPEEELTELEKRRIVTYEQQQTPFEEGSDRTQAGSQLPSASMSGLTKH